MVIPERMVTPSDLNTGEGRAHFRRIWTSAAAWSRVGYDAQIGSFWRTGAALPARATPGRDDCGGKGSNRQLIQSGTSASGPCMFDPIADPGHKAMRVVFTLTGAVPRRV